MFRGIREGGFGFRREWHGNAVQRSKSVERGGGEGSGRGERFLPICFRNRKSGEGKRGRRGGEAVEGGVNG
mgnify:CR=1 FL=1